MDREEKRDNEFLERSDFALLKHLAAAARAARHAIETSRPEHQALLDTLHGFDASVKAAHVEVGQSAPATIRDIVDSFRTKYDSLRAHLDAISDRAATDLAAAFGDIERDAAFVTIMLFGRTRAGKSTTMEALTAGDGASIGSGRQHTTTDIQTYYYPNRPTEASSSAPTLRIVDTPGIEGFQGDRLAEMAERFIERSDHIFFLFTDDKATADELERFGMIRTQGKGVTVLLNVKAADEDLDLLVAKPSLVFKADEIEQHTNRICGYLERRFGMPPPRLIAIHARAAWLSRIGAELPEGVNDRRILRKHSRLGELENRISDFIRHEARLARLCAPRDLLLGYSLSLKTELCPLAGEFRLISANMERLARRLMDGTEKARKRIARRFPLLRGRFQAASDAIPGMVDEVISAGGRGDALNARWQALLRDHGVTDALDWFTSAGQRDFQEQIDDEVQAASFDHQFANADGLDDHLGGYYDAEESQRRHKYSRAGIRTVAGVGASSLAGWAVLNFWNPTGWVAAVALGVVAVAGVAGEEVARKATNEWDRASRSQLYEKRVNIVAKLRERLWADYHAVRKCCDGWLDGTQKLQRDIVQEIARPINASSRRLWQATRQALEQLDLIEDHLNEALVRDLFAAIVPECENGIVHIESVARQAGYRTKVMICASTMTVKAVAVCVGRQGGRIQQIRHALGNEPIDLVDATADAETRILQALGVARHSGAVVATGTGEYGMTAQVRFVSISSSRSAIGPRGANVRLASRLIGINIEIVGT